MTMSPLGKPPAFALALSLAAVSTATAQSEPASEQSSAQPIGVHVEIVADTLPSARQAAVKAEVERQFDEIATAKGLVKAEPSDADLVIRLEFTQPNPKAEIFVIHGLALHGDEVLRRDQTRTCMECTPAEIAANGLMTLDPAVEELEARRAEAAAQREAKAAARAAEAPPIVDETPAPRVKRMGTVGYVGIASSAIGLGSAIAGGVLVHRGTEPIGTGLTLTDYRPPGQALIGVGLGLMVIGGVLQAVDLAVLTPRRRSRAHAELDGFTFIATANGPGVVVSGRF